MLSSAGTPYCHAAFPDNVKEQIVIRRHFFSLTSDSETPCEQLILKVNRRVKRETLVGRLKSNVCCRAHPESTSVLFGRCDTSARKMRIASLRGICRLGSAREIRLRAQDTPSDTRKNNCGCCRFDCASRWDFATS